MRFVPQHILCGLERVRTQSWTYDTAAGGTGLLASHVYPSGMKVEYGYTNGLPTSIRVNGVAFLSNVTYGPGGRITGWTWANGRTMVRTFDGLGRPKTWTMWDVPDARILGYDAAGNLETITRGSDGVVLRRYGYDPRGQLTSYGGSGVTAQSYEYDLAGNRTSYARGANLTAYQYPATSNRLASLSGAETASFGYDANGNPTTYRGQTFLYDIRGRLVGIRDKSKYVVDGLGRRLTKIVRSADAPATFPGDATGDNLLDAEDWWTVAAHRGQLAASYPRDNCDGIGTYIDDADVQCVKNQEAAAIAAGYLEWTDFAYDQDGRPIGEYTSGGRIRETIYLGDLPVGVWDGTTAYRVFADHLGTPRGIVNAANQNIWQWEGEPFGNHLPTGSFLYNARFPGQTYDAESGLFYNGFRDYDPRTGRYVESDPVGLEGGLNLYTYVENDPLGWIDPWGLLPPGHHYIPQQVYKSYPLPAETKEIFDRATTGPVEHYFDKGHRQYNKAAREFFEEFLKRNNIDPSKMTPEQAKQCLDELKKSQEPSIKDYLEFLKRGGGRFRNPFLSCPLCEVFKYQWQNPYGYGES
jgi:RHS repeat-associated protein